MAKADRVSPEPKNEAEGPDLAEDTTEAEPRFDTRGAVEGAKVKWWQLVISISVMLGISMAITVLFSQTFEVGDDIYTFLLVESWRTYLAFGVVAGFATLIYITDCSHWKG